VSIDDAMKVILSTQQLDRKLLNESTVLIYPNTQPKQREHQELVTRSFYLNTADAKQAQTLVRTIAKTRDMFIDERLNMLVIRDTPEVVRLVERLIASIDMPDPEVVLEVEVMEVGSSRVDELGLQWPEQVSYGLTGGGATVELGQRSSFRASIANPALLATMRESVTRANVLANPRLRARNHEKAKVLIGEKLPVFTTTSTANVGVSASVNYLDVGLKLEVEPSVQLDGDVIMRVNLEVSTLIGKVLGPQGSVAYQVGTRQATTSLRLRDGETQVLAGLIRDEDTKGIAGVPGLASTPIIGRLFGLHTDTRNKTEVILLITPRVVRNIGVPDVNVASAPAGVDTNPGAQSMRLKRNARVTIPMSAGARTAADGSTRSDAPTTAPTTALTTAPGMAVLSLSTSGRIEAGATAAVTLQNRSAVALKGEIEFDAAMLQSAQSADARGDARDGRLAFRLAAGAEQVFMLRALPAAEGKTTAVSAVSVGAVEGQGADTMVQIQGDGQIAVGRR
jgi:general secretion pathway protein D